MYDVCSSITVKAPRDTAASKIMETVSSTLRFGRRRRRLIFARPVPAVDMMSFQTWEKPLSLCDLQLRFVSLEIPHQTGHLIRLKSATDSEENRPVIPIQIGHPPSGYKATLDN